MRILIASGLYPPDVGGPAQYARNLYEIWKKQGHAVKVAAYRWERAFPTGVRHILHMIKILRKGWNVDMIVVLDTWSTALPAMAACALMRKKYIIRTGGDFLWEAYVERTGDMVLFRDFYATVPLSKLSRKERLIFRVSGPILRRAAAIMFNTQWQRDIFEPVYKLDPKKNCVVENFYGSALPPVEDIERTFVAWTRQVKWKNVELLREAFAEAQAEIKRRGLGDFELYTQKIMYENSIEKMRRSWATILVSLGDISPNMIQDCLMTGTPYIVTEELGITERVKHGAVFVDPKNKKDIADKIVWMADPKNRAAQAVKVRQNTFTHSWEQIADEIVKVWEKA